VKGDELRALKT